jgi:pyruvate formate lyase activating enzyme
MKTGFGKSSELCNALCGQVFNIQKFSVHDGPGIRTTVFLKGCPLRCYWCANPESQNPDPDIFLNTRKCIGTQRCGRCLESCPEGAVTGKDDGTVAIEGSRCNRCGKCAEVCEPKAIARVGYTISVHDLLDTVNQDCLFYSYSGGGITLSGGEPLMQTQFSVAVLKGALDLGLETAMETCAYAAYSDVKAACAHLDHLLVDLKIMDRQAHQAATGLSNDLIVRNLKQLFKDYPRLALTIRMPIIPGFNDSKAHVRDVAQFVGQNARAKLELLPYHRLGESKYQFLRRPYRISGLRPPTKELMEELKSVAAKYACVLLL